MPPVGTRHIRQFMEAMAPEAEEEMIGARCLVLAPHPDDEVLGCGGTIAQKVRNGADVWIIFLTDGRHGVDGPSEDAVAVRKAEAMRAAQALGVSSDRLLFFGYEDGRLSESVNQGIERIQRLVESLQVNALFIPYRRDSHPDHHAAWVIGEACRRNDIRVLEYPIWFGPWLWPRLGWKSRLRAAFYLRDVIHAVKIRVADVVDIKRRALAAYHSQVSAFERQAWGPAFLDNFINDHELFFMRQTPRDGSAHLSARLSRIMMMMARAALPIELRRWLRVRTRTLRQWPPVGRVRFGSLRRVTPISRAFGYARGRPVDRYYIENFLAAHVPDIHGHVLEIGDRAYTQRFGGGRVERSHVLHGVDGNPKATIVADLSRADQIRPDTFDCIILTQTLHLIYDIRAAVQNLYRILKPGGVILATFPGISQISRYDMDRWGDCWRLTTHSALQLFEEFFPPANISVNAHGNVLVAVALLQGLACEELRQEELDYRDPDYEVSIVVRAEKPAVWAR